jgi:hypothetical protein
MERIIRAAKAIKEEFPDTTSDLGFKHYTLVEPSSDTLDKLEKFDPTKNKLFADKDCSAPRCQDIISKILSYAAPPLIVIF